MAMQAPPERLAYVTMLNVGANGQPDGIGVVDLDPASATYGQLVGGVDFPNGANELHHFGWNACSACLCPQSPHPHMERRYLVVPGIASSRIHILDTKPDPKHPKLVKIIEPDEFTKKTGYSAPHTLHCGPDAIYGSALGSIWLILTGLAGLAAVPIPHVLMSALALIAGVLILVGR